MTRPSLPLLLTAASAAGLLLLVVGCATTRGDYPKLDAVDSMDLERFMGDWYVIAVLPNRYEENAFNSLEQYRLRDDGKIGVDFSYNEGSLDGKKKTMDFVATVKDSSNTVWGMSPFWPISLPYIVIDLADDYRYTVIGHPSRKYAWVMARDTTMSEGDWQAATQTLTSQGFSVDDLRIVPHDSAPEGGVPQS